MQNDENTLTLVSDEEAARLDIEETEKEYNDRINLEDKYLNDVATAIVINTKEEFPELAEFVRPLITKEGQVLDELIYEETNDVRYKLILDYLKDIITILLSRATTGLEPIISQIQKFLGDISIVYTMEKYSYSYEEAIKFLEGVNHYEKIIKDNPKYSEIYNNMQEYFNNEIKEKNLDKDDLEVRKEHFFHDDTSIIDNMDSFHIVFQINKNCNFKCTYCYEGLDKVTEILTIEDVPKIVQGIKIFQEHLILKNKGLPEDEQEPTALSFSILGGEPTIVPKKITQELTRLLHQELELKYIILITNNYNAKKTLNFFHPDFPKEKIKLQVSYDGGVIQDKYRLTSARKSSRELVVQETRKLLDNGIKVSMKATLPPEAMSHIVSAVKDYITLEEEMNINNKSGQNFSYYPTMDTTSFLMTSLRKDFAAGKLEQKEVLFNDLHTTFEILLKLEIDRLLNGDKAFTRWFRELSFSANKVLCSAGSSLFGIDQEGEARYCHRTEYDMKKDKDADKLFYGNVKNGSFIEKFEATKTIINNISEENLDMVAHCSGCKTLTCVKCPMVNIAPTRGIDTSVSGNMFLDMYSHSDSLTCELNNTISVYLYMYFKIINKRNF